MKRGVLVMWGVALGSLSLHLGAAPPDPPASPSAAWATVKGRDGRALRAYVAGPEDAAAGVLVVHDYFGISDFTRASVERLAAQGYRALAIDLYGGKTATAHEPATALMQTYQAQDRVVSDSALRAGLEALERPGRRLATLGFSMGGAEALRAALADPAAVHAAVIVYGFGFDTLPQERLLRMRGPVLAVVGALDEGALQASLELLRVTRESGPATELYVLPRVGHAFAQPLFNGGQGYDLAATHAAWQVIDGFLLRHIGAADRMQLRQRTK